MKLRSSIAVILLATVSVSTSYVAAQSGRLSPLKPFTAPVARAWPNSAKTGASAAEDGARVIGRVNPGQAAEVAYIDAELAPLVQNVRDEARVPDELNAQLNNMLRATFCEGVLEGLKTGGVPSLLSIQSSLDRNLLLYGLVVNPKVRSSISLGLSLALADPGTTTPQEFLAEIHLQNACEDFLRGRR